MSQRQVRRPHFSRGLAACLFAGGLLLSACGDEGAADLASGDEVSVDPSLVPTPSPAPVETDPPVRTEPLCGEVWIAGDPLPDPYKGCYDADTFVKAEAQRCAFGSKLFTYDDRFYAAQFNTINETPGLADSPAFQKALEQCGG